MQQGVIARAADTDFFRFWAMPGTLQLRLDLLGYPSAQYLNGANGANWTVPGSNLNAVLMVGVLGRGWSVAEPGIARSLATCAPVVRTGEFGFWVSEVHQEQRCLASTRGMPMDLRA